MTDDMIEISKRAVACRGWRWMPGMLAVEVAGPGMSLTGGRPVRVDECWHAVNVWRPDLTDAATLGCLLALVREAWGDPTLCVVLDTSDGRWCVGRWEDGLAMRGRGGVTEAEALVAALEGAP